MTTDQRAPTRGGIGASVLRHEDPPLLCGRARYVADVSLPGQLAMVVVRSPVAHGTLRAVDTSDAVALPGVEAAFTAGDLVDSLGHVPRIPPRVSFDETVLPYLQPLLAVDRIRYTGEPVAVVVAEDRYLAEDAAELVFADIDQHPAVVDAGPQAEQGEQLFEAGNLVTTLQAEFGDVEAAFRDAEQVIEVELSIGRHSGVPMETRGLAVEFDPGTGRLTVYGATKVPHWNLRTTAELLDMPPSRMRMRETAVGGGFGVRGELYPEDVLAVWVADRLRRSVSWIEDRREHLVAANHSRQQRHRARIAGDRDGRIAAITSDFDMDAGAYARTHSIRVADLTLSMIPGPYDLDAYRGSARCVVTNKTPTGTYRAPGRFESSFVRERLIDLFAAEIGMDPVEVRRRNLIRPRPDSVRSTPVLHGGADAVQRRGLPLDPDPAGGVLRLEGGRAAAIRGRVGRGGPGRVPREVRAGSVGDGGGGGRPGRSGAGPLPGAPRSARGSGLSWRRSSPTACRWTTERSGSSCWTPTEPPTAPEATPAGRR